MSDTQRLDELDESWLSLATTIGGYRSMFVDKAASVISSKCNYATSIGVRWEMLRSAMMRYDAEAVRRFAYDWGYRRSDPVKVADITKHIPGEHFHVAAIQKKFDTLGEAERAIGKSGMEVGRLIYVDVRAFSGD